MLDEANVQHVFYRILEQRRIVDTGTDAELRARRGLYSRMWREQSDVSKAGTPA